jgi:5-hydroxyisourate hydrolase / 2-oxo-4-hydroxy-4-carboxy-5-ureidoimidazoline decarboxylase
MSPVSLSVEDVLRVNGSRRFAAAMAAASSFATFADALLAARRIWLNEVRRLSDPWYESSLFSYPSLPALTCSISLAALMDCRIGSKVDVNGWLEAFAAHPAIGTTSPSVPKSVHPPSPSSAPLPVNSAALFTVPLSVAARQAVCEFCI